MTISMAVHCSIMIHRILIIIICILLFVTNTPSEMVAMLPSFFVTFHMTTSFFPLSLSVLLEQNSSSGER